MLKQAIGNAFGNPNTATHGYTVSGVKSFEDLDEPQIRKDLGIDAVAALRGQKNLPMPDEDALDDIQQTIITKINGFRSSAATGYAGEMSAYGLRLSRLSFLSDSTGILNTAKKAEGDFQALVHNAVMELNHLKEERDRASADLSAFREQHRLRREPQLPKMSKFLSFAIIFFIFGIESVFNAMFFAERVFGGVVQGFAEAIIFSIVNVAFGFMGGRLSINYCHNATSRKVLGTLGIVVVLVVLLFNNFLAAHYRAVLVADVDIFEAANRAWDSLLTSPFGIPDSKSWQLLGLGLLAAFATGWKAWKMDDPYPGYGAVARAAEEKSIDFIVHKKRHLGEVTNAHEKVCKQIDAEAKRLDNGLAEFRQVLENRRRFHDSYVAHLDHLEDVANRLLGLYRKINRESRSDNARPPCLDFNYEISRTDLTAPPPIDPEVESLSPVVKDTIGQLRAQINVLHDARKDTMDKMAAIG